MEEQSALSSVQAQVLLDDSIRLFFHVVKCWHQFLQTQKTRITFRKVSTLETQYSLHACYNYIERGNCFITEVPAIHIYTIAHNTMTGLGCVAD